MRKLAALGALLALAAAAAAGGLWLYRESRRPTGFILISIDTLRADHLGAYGYPLDTSPFFNELAARGTLFENAIVQLPGTLPSHMSIFTGLYPAEHDVYPPDSVLSPDIATLPEAFRAAGYRTAGFTEGGYVAGHYGFERGFDHFRAVNTGKPGAAGRTFDLVKEWIDTLEPGDEFFVFVHTYEVHDPYIPMEGYGDQAWPGEPPEIWEPTGANLTAASVGELPITREALEYFVALYDAGIRYVDDVLRDFMEHVWAAGLARDTTIVITSDHGEEFLEHGSFVHRQVYNETLHVPLLVRRLGQRRGSRVKTLVESVDLAPTLLELAGLEETGMRPSGTSLVPLLGGDGDGVGSEAFAEGMSVPTRSIYRRTESGLHQLLVTRREPVDGRLSARRRLSFDWTEPTLRLAVGGVGAPADLEVLADGDLVHVERVVPGEVRTVEVRLPEGVRKHDVELRMEGCQEDDPPCEGFFLEGFEAVRRELYRLDDDPRQTEDLSALRPALTRELEEALAGYRWELRARAGREELSDEQTERLKALGYLQ